MSSGFELRIIESHWLGDSCNDDLCLHGKVAVRIGDEIISDFNSGEWVLNVTGLYLLRSLYSNYEKELYGSQLLPCCGHMMYIQEGQNTVTILGCPEGIDWTINHLSDNLIEHISEKGSRVIQTRSEYCATLSPFILQVEKAYADCPKKLPDDPYDEEVYNCFWKEWNDLKKGLE